MNVVEYAAFESERFPVALVRADHTVEPPPIAAQPVAFPFAKMPVGAFPELQSVGVPAKAVAVAAFPVVFWFRVGNDVIFAALIVGAV